MHSSVDNAGSSIHTTELISLAGTREVDYLYLYVFIGGAFSTHARPSCSSWSSACGKNVHLRNVQLYNSKNVHLRKKLPYIPQGVICIGFTRPQATGNP